MVAVRMQPAIASQSRFMPLQPAARHSTVANAERREMMAGLALGLGAVAGKNAFAVTGVDIKDDRAAVKKGFDLNTIAAAKEGSVQTEFLAAKKKFISDIEKLDLAIVNKNQKLALDLFATATGSMDSVLKLVA